MDECQFEKFQGLFIYYYYYESYDIIEQNVNRANYLGTSYPVT